MNQKILIQFPTAMRPDKAIPLLKKYQEMLLGTNHIIHVSCDTQDESMNNPEVRGTLEGMNVAYTFWGNRTKNEAMNRNVKGLDWDILLVGSDDMVPVVGGYDEIIREEFARKISDLDGVLKTYDGLQHSINIIPIIGRKYFDRFGYIMNEEYSSFYCDNEFTEVAQILGKEVTGDQQLFRHDHFSYGKCPSDALYERNQKFWDIDHQTYIRRKRANFGQ